jgi:hypothetical protein
MRWDETVSLKEDLEAEKAEIRRLRVEALFALLILLSPIILVLLVSQSVRYPFLNFVTINKGVWDYTFIIYSFSTTSIGLGSGFALISLRRLLKNHIALSRGYTLAFSRVQKFKVMVPWWAIVGGVIMVFGGFGEVQYFAVGGYLLILAGGAATVLGLVANRRNAKRLSLLT